MTSDTGRLNAFRRVASRVDGGALILFVVGILELAAVSRLRFLGSQDANWDFLNYHAYVPASLLDGSWFTDFHPAGIQTYLTPYQDLIQWPLISAVPAPVATLVLVAVHVAIFIPAGLIVRTTVPSLSLWKSLGLGLVGVSGAMAVTELGTTMGDFPPAALMAWALYLLLTLVAGASAPARRAVGAGLLVGIAVALKFTVVYLAPGFVVVAICVAFTCGWRIGALFAATATIVGGALYAPWALVLTNNSGSPVFPLFNGLFRAARYPGIDFQDTRFPVKSLADLVTLPLRQAQGTAATAELQFTDARWLIAVVLLAAGIAIAAARLARGRRGEGWPSAAPVLVLMAFWAVSYVVWARIFGIQRYAILLEVLALPVAVGGLSLVAARLTEGRIATVTWIVLAAAFAFTTKGVDFGHRPMSTQPLIPRTAIPPLDRYNAVLIASPPLAFLSPVTQDSDPSDARVWLGIPFNAADRAVGERIVAGKSVGVVFYSFDRPTASDAAASIGLRLGDECTTFESPVPNSLGMGTIFVCPAVPSP